MATSVRTTVEDEQRAGARQLAVVELEPVAWDAFAVQHPRGHLLQAAAWGALKGSVGWHARRVAVVGPEGPRAGAQVLIRRRLGLSVAYVPRGPLLSDDEAANRALLAALDRLARRERAVFLRLEPNVLEDEAQAGMLHSALLLQGFQPSQPLQPRSSVHLDLAPAPERLLAAMSKGHRADIKRAAREGVATRLGQHPADLDAFYAIMEQTGARAGFGIHSRAYYRTAWEQLAPAGAAQLFLAERDGQTLAAFLIFAWAGAGLYLYGGSTEEGLKSGANHALQWQAIQWARERGCRLYDFWGVPDQFGLAAVAADAAERARLEEAAKADPLYGVFRFKKGFGGRVVRYLPAYDRVYIRPLYALWQRRMSG
jgi:lipid II:glycine glycyltransferase (peptidoglycan interpeptide bridge formation enzyme)